MLLHGHTEKPVWFYCVLFTISLLSSENLACYTPLFRKIVKQYYYQVHFKPTRQQAIAFTETLKSDGIMNRLTNRLYLIHTENHLRRQIQMRVSFYKALHLIIRLNSSLPYDKQVVVLQQHLIIQIQHSNINSISTQRPSKHQQNPSLQIPLLPWLRKEPQPRCCLWHVMPQCHPHRIPTHHTFILPWKTINGRIKRHENNLSQEWKNPIGNPWNWVLLLDHNLNAFQPSS